MRSSLLDFRTPEYFFHDDMRINGHVPAVVDSSNRLSSYDD